MSVAKVLKLAEHRDRRLHRLALARAMLGGDAARLELLDHLAEIAERTRFDRVAVVWIDEYGPGLVHPHLVLDLLSDCPRRFFATDPLQKAWDLGIPGAYDEAAVGGGDDGTAFAVALGSDGARGWFLVADAVVRRTPLDAVTRERLLFLAGECSSIVLHRDLDEAADGASTNAFAGWRFLQDLEGHEADAVRSEVVGRRFEVGRLVAGLVDEDLCLAQERRIQLAGRARESLSRELLPGTEERTGLEAILDPYESGDVLGAARACVDAGLVAERLDHPEGALELYRLAYEMGVALRESSVTVEAARASGRVLRRRGRWGEADRWYARALAIAERAELWDLLARTRAGLAVVHKERGDFDAARSGLEEALRAADAAKDADTTASVYQDLMGLEQIAGNLPVAARHGWRAINTYRDERGKTRCLVSFAWILKELGDFEAAEDAYDVALRSSDEHYHRIYAADGFAHMAALRGDAEAFDRRAAACDALGWEHGPVTAKAEIIYFRGLAHGMLGRSDEARRWLERAVDFAEEHGLGRIVQRARDALRGAEGARSEPGIQEKAPREVRDGLRAMRERLTAVG